MVAFVCTGEAVKTEPFSVTCNLAIPVDRWMQLQGQSHEMTFHEVACACLKLHATVSVLAPFAALGGHNKIESSCLGVLFRLCGNCYMLVAGDVAVEAEVWCGLHRYQQLQKPWGLRFLGGKLNPI